MQIGNLTILMVEDNAFQRMLLTKMLRPQGAVVLEAGNGAEALTLMHDGIAPPIDLVISDLDMPGMDGLEFLRRLSSTPHHPPVIISSSLDEKLLSSTMQMSRLYGIPLLGALQKPINLNALKSCLDKQPLAERKWQPPADTPKFTLEDILLGVRNGEFQPYFQPKVSFKTGLVTGVEALARWLHPQHGVIAPHAFIPLLEQHAQLDELTFDMLRKSAEACLAFHDKGHPVNVSVNLSLSSLKDIDLADRIIRIVRDARLAPRFIVLEITESSAMTDTGAALENLARLVLHGFHLSIDDYGTGYSSMQQLARIAFSELKIDQSFVKDLADNNGLRIVVESSVDMARKLRMHSVADGVESRQDWDVLKEIGCDMAQGYFFSPPMEAGKFVEFVTNFKQNFAQLQASPVPPAHDKSQTRILVVDDDDFARSLIVRVLHDSGFPETSEAGGVASALKFLESRSFGIIITDIDIPGMNGLQFIQMIRTGRTHAKPDVRVLVLTAYSQTKILGTALALDVNGFLLKPIAPAIMQEKLDQALSEKLHVRPAFTYDAINTDISGRAGIAPRVGGAIPVNRAYCDQSQSTRKQGA